MFFDSHLRLVQLYKSTSAWRKSLKNIAFHFVKARYNLPLDEHEIPDGPGHSSQDILDLGAWKVDNLLKDDNFARDGTDDQVCLLRYFTTQANSALRERPITTPILRFGISFFPSFIQTLKMVLQKTSQIISRVWFQITFWHWLLPSCVNIFFS